MQHIVSGTGYLINKMLQIPISTIRKRRGKYHPNYRSKIT
jgi:hypothetical protein